jgi:hypothetical protein
VSERWRTLVQGVDAARRDPEVVRAGGGVEGRVRRHHAVAAQLQQMLVERLHAVVLTLGDRVGDEIGPIGIEDELAQADRHHQQSDRGHQAAVRPRDQALRPDPAQRARQRHPRLLVLMRRVHVDDAVDRLGRVGCVQRRQQMPGLGRLQRRSDRFEVTHLTDEDDVGVLARSARSAAPKFMVSRPTSRWSTIARLS